MTSHALSDAFESAKTEFLSRLSKGIPASFEEFTTINEVYKAAEEIQAAQASTRMRRNFGKIQPFLECLRHYGEVIETFVTVKPDILALIWGPIKFLLLTSITYNKSFDNLVGVMAQISQSLPAFEKYTELFQGSQPIQQVLCLFYQDILDIYSTLLDFFRHTGWKSFFDALWPKSAERIRVIMENVKEHKLLMDNSITLAHVVEAHAARHRAFKEFETQHEFRQRQDLDAVKSSLDPILYDRNLQRLKARRVVQSGGWLLEQEEYNHWIDPSDKESRLLWLQGIPGAGKTFLSSSIIERIANRGDPMVFAFLDYQSREDVSALQLLHSFIWQMALDHEKLQAPLILAHKQEYRRINSDLDFVKDLFGQFLDSMPTIFIVIDGLDEILQQERRKILRITLEILQRRNVKVLISSRPEDDISNIISREAEPLRVHDCNNQDVEAYVNSRAALLVSDASIAESGLAQEISNLMKEIAAKAEGMFLYARLVCDSIELLGDIDSIKESVENLPHGLNEAYDRILFRVTEGLPMRQREDARQILALITCCVVPLSKNEIQLAVYTAQGRDPSNGCERLFLNILDRCGPIIEEFDGHFRFVHFSAREYLLSPQSNHYLTESTANACVASMCIKYLNSTCFDVDIDDNMLSLHIKCGAFVLLAYVCSHWLHHISKVERRDLQTMRNDIECLIGARVNASFVDEAVVRESQDPEYLSSDGEEINRLLGSARAFSKKRKRDLSFDDDGNWNCMDPLTFTETEVRFRHALESMLCKPGQHRTECLCEQLKSIYGSGIYRCGRPGCLAYRIGFDSKSKRDGHAQTHTRPFKCQNSGCTFAHLGFAKKIDLESHLVQFHDRNLHIVSEVTLGRTNTASEEDMKAILIDAVLENDLSIIQAEEEAVQNNIFDLLLSACQGRSSDAMVKHLISAISENTIIRFGLSWNSEILRKASSALIKHGRYDVARTLCKIPNGKTSWIRPKLELVGRTRCADLIEAVWSTMDENDVTFSMFRDVVPEIFPPEPDTQAEILALECLAKLQPRLSGKSFLLVPLGRRCCSVAIADLLLSYGADINADHGGLRPLSAAAKKTSREAAEFMEFLVRKGAHTSLSVNGKPLSELPGPRNIQKWIGITWEELVKNNAPSV